MTHHACLSPGAPFPPTLDRTNLGTLPLFWRGKVRDMIDLGDHLLMVATDRVSAFDVVMNQAIPGKGIVLTAFSEFWFGSMGHIVPNHLVSANPDDFPPELQPYRDQLEGRALLVRKTRRIDVECVVRGYLSGSAWAEYRQHGTMAGEPLPTGMQESERFPRPIFTPATKEESGHDINIPMSRMRELIGATLANRVAEISVSLYQFAEEHARKRGIIVADTKFEFGLLGDQLILIDEAVTPDSSRFWPADRYEVGHGQPAFDKQPLRDYLEGTGWNKTPPPPDLPDDVVRDTAERYREAYLRVVAS